MDAKTNPMRHLDKLGIPYRVHFYGDEPLSGMEVAEAMGEDPAEAFKTLVTESKDRRLYVFAVPVDGDLDMKKAAASVGEKSLQMIRSKDLLQQTGYVHGGCSPLCLKKPMRVTFDSSALDHERIYFSAGRIGYQIEMAVADLPRALDFQFADVRKPLQRSQWGEPSPGGGPRHAQCRVQQDVDSGEAVRSVGQQIHGIDGERGHRRERAEEAREDQRSGRVARLYAPGEHEVRCGAATDDVDEERGQRELGIHRLVDAVPRERAEGASCGDRRERDEGFDLHGAVHRA